MENEYPEVEDLKPEQEPVFPHLKTKSIRWYHYLYLWLKPTTIYTSDGYRSYTKVFRGKTFVLKMEKFDG